jgi:hypothetical protein
MLNSNLDNLLQSSRDFSQSILITSQELPDQFPTAFL